ncbi:septation protein SepH [Bifidobacterium sp. ESL0800]|uniref:septation protein SepH n=1 Tax=Bifidobacterium sp. ESL0800 TaxID=2983236 RepID=UPI0023F83528|nr:septation protein SepH [Bifidobacterium sp. ESL0800]WEV76379.1 septation protein SepH [Bifidobacterium sp. ESL0800]
MSISSVTDARFDHVDEDGELVFVSKGLKFRIPVDDTLEHAILEARQILSEAEEINNPGLAQTLPISSIQALIRAGAQPEKVAEKYGLSQALVRRFSAAVETEKQYAIEQFLAVSAPKGSKVHSVEDLIACTLAAARIGMESVKWGATRRGREPWLITATFSTQRNRIRAEWTWNMHDNTVECQNTAAQILLGETDTSIQRERTGEKTSDAAAQVVGSGQTQENTEGTATNATASSARSDDNDAMAASTFAASQALPGDSVRSARIASTVASMQEQTHEEPETSQPRSGADPVSDGNAEDNSVAMGSVSLPYPAPTIGRQSTSTNPQTPSMTATPSVPADAMSLPLPDRTNETPSQTFSVLGNESPQQPGTDHSDTAQLADERNQTAKDGNNGSEHHDHKHGKRKSGRSAVPSWDEILFGE